MAVLDPTTGMHTEINERGPSVSEHELELFEQKLLYLARGASICVFAGSLPRGLGAGHLRQADPLGAQARRADDRRHRRRAAELAVRAEPDVVSPNELEAEELAGHEFGGDRRSRAGRRRDHPPGAGGGDHDGARRLLRVRPRGGRPRCSIGSRSSRSRRISPIGSGDAFLAGYVAARYAGRDAGRVPAVRRRLRGRVDPARRRRDPGPGRRSSGCSRASPPSVSSSPRTSPRAPAGQLLARGTVRTASAGLPESSNRPAAKVDPAAWLPPSRSRVSRRKWGSP